MRKLLFGALALLFILNLFTDVLAQDVHRTGDLNTRIQELSKKIPACGSDESCVDKITQEIDALVQEHIGINKSMGQTMGGQTMVQMQKGIPSCVAQFRPGWSCLPLKVSISDKIDKKMYTSYCKNPGLLPCGEEWYIANDFAFEYTATGSGILNYTKDFQEFEIWVRSLAADNKVNVLHENKRWQDQSYVGGKPVYKWASRSGPAGAVSVADPFAFTVMHPDPDAVTSNINFDGLTVNCNDPDMSGACGSSLRAGNKTIHYMMTPDIVKAMVTSGQFSKIFHWRDTDSDGRSYEDHTVTIKIATHDLKPDKPGELVVSPGDGFKSLRPDPKEPFAPLSKAYTLKNTGDKTINFGIGKKVKWLNLDKNSGSLPPGGSATVVVSVNVPVASKLAEDSYKDILVFTNTTDGKGNTTRRAEVSLAEEQTWQVRLTGMETDDIGGKIMYMKINNKWGNKVVEYGVRFNYKMIVEFTIKKKKGKWLYKEGKITASYVSAVPVFDPTAFFVKSTSCNNCNKVNNLAGSSIGGEVTENTVRLFWPHIVTNAAVLNKLNLAWTAWAPKGEGHKETMKGYSNNEFFSEGFFDYTLKHYLPLKNGEMKPFQEHRKSSSDKFRQKGKPPISLYHRYVMKRIK